MSETKFTESVGGAALPSVSLMLAVLLAAACGPIPDPERMERPSNGAYQVARLFEHDGCVVYRFYDGGGAGSYVYFVKCRDSDARTEWYVPRPKRTPERFSVPTGLRDQRERPHE